MRADDFARIVGDDAALRAMSRRGGQEFYVPKTPTRGMLEFFGSEASRALSKAFGGTYIIIPSGRRWRKSALAAKGLSAQSIARAMGISTRALRRNGGLMG